MKKKLVICLRHLHLLVKRVGLLGAARVAAAVNSALRRVAKQMVTVTQSPFKNCLEIFLRFRKKSYRKHFAALRSHSISRQNLPDKMRRFQQRVSYFFENRLKARALRQIALNAAAKNFAKVFGIFDGYQRRNTKLECLKKLIEWKNRKLNPVVFCIFRLLLKQK